MCSNPNCNNPKLIGCSLEALIVIASKAIADIVNSVLELVGMDRIESNPGRIKG